MPFFGVPIRNGLPIGLGSVAGFGVQQFDPSQLFEGGTVAGAWYDPSDLSTMFDTSAGTTPVAMPGQGAAVPVGLMLDKSQGLVLGSELVTNGDFSGGTTGWQAVNGTISEVSGRLRVSYVTSNPYARQGVTCVVGKTYVLTGQYFGGTETTRLYIAESNTGVNPQGIIDFTGDGAATVRFHATATTMWVIAAGRGLTTGEFVEFDNISVRELPGNHAIAFNNTTARPELRARVNLLVATATLSTQSVTTQATSYTLSFAGAGSITLSGTATGSYSAGTHTITCTAGTLTLTVSGTVTTADLRPANSGALLPAYQAVVDANTYDTNGFPLYLRFDGIDDSMYTPANLNLSGTDKVTVFAGVRKLSDAASAILTELSDAGITNPQAFSMWAPFSTTVEYAVQSRGTASSASGQRLQIDNAAFVAPVSNTFTGIFNISGDISSARLNGVSQGTATADQGAGNFGTYPLFIGARNNASSWLNGQIYSLIIAGSAVSAGNISATEQWVAGKTGIQI